LTQLPEGVLAYRYPARTYGEPYQWSCVVVPHGETAELCLAQGRHPDRADLARTLRRAGFRRVYWQRERGGGMHRTKVFELGDDDG